MQRIPRRASGVPHLPTATGAERVLRGVAAAPMRIAGGSHGTEVWDYPEPRTTPMSYTLSVFSLDIGGAERLLRRSTIADEALGPYMAAPDAALRAMPSMGGTRPDGFRITDGRGRTKVAHTSCRPSRRASA